MSNSISNNPDRKNHYYIGFRLNKEDNSKLIGNLNYAKRLITSQTNGIIEIKNPVKMYHTRFLYLGYLDIETGSKITKYLGVWIQALVDYINKISKNSNDIKLSRECIIDPILKVHDSTRSYRKIALHYENYLISEIIVPILREITDPILTLKYSNSQKKIFSSHINIMSIAKTSSIVTIQNKLDNLNITFEDRFKLNSIDILSAQNELRQGRASKDDEMMIQIVKQFNFE